MNNVKQILIPVDFSATSEIALKYVSGLVKNEKGIALKLLHVCSTETSDPDMMQLEERMQQLVDQCKGFVNHCSFQISRGALLKSILQFHDSDNSDIIIIGTRGSSDEHENTLASALVLEADCPVLVIPETLSGFKIKNIALALGPNVIDNSGGLQVLHDIARAFSATVHVLTVNRDGGKVTIESENQDVLEYYLNSLLYFHAFPNNSDIEQGIADYVEQHNIDLLAILPRNHAQKTTPSEGRLTKLLTIHTKVPLLTID